jgi:adenylate kinase
MGWFKDKYGDDAHPILPAEDYSRIYDEFGKKAANETLQDVQDGKISVKTLEKYLLKDTD